MSPLTPLLPPTSVTLHNAERHHTAIPLYQISNPKEHLLAMPLPAAATGPGVFCFLPPQGRRDTASTSSDCHTLMLPSLRQILRCALRRHALLITPSVAARHRRQLPPAARRHARVIASSIPRDAWREQAHEHAATITASPLPPAGHS